MIPGFEALVEQRIKKAQKKGDLDNLPGEGKTLKFDDEHVPEEFRLAHKILKNSGFFPPEVDLRKKIHEAESLLACIEYDSPERQRIQKKLNYLFARLDTVRSSTGSSTIPESYRNRLVKRML